MDDLQNEKHSGYYEGHFYTFLDEKGTRIAHSAGSRGWVVDDDSDGETERATNFKMSTFYFLKLRVPNQRKK